MIKIICYLVLLSISVIATAQETIMTPVNPAIQATDFILPEPDGNLIKLSDYKGKYVLINFWAHWCSPCLKEFPDMQALYDQADKDNFEIIAIHAGPFNEQAAEIVKHFKIGFTIVSDAETSLKGWDIPALPTSFLVNPQGEIIYKAVGPREWSHDALQSLMTSSQSTLPTSTLISRK